MPAFGASSRGGNQLLVGVTRMISPKVPLWLRFVLLVAAVGLASGASLFAYRYYTRPVTLSVAVGSIDGEAAKAMSAIASRTRFDQCACSAQGHR